MIETYTTWYHHGERLDQASSSYVTRVETVESNVDHSEQVMNILNDVYPYASSNTNHEGGDDGRPTMDSEAFKNYEKLLKNAKQELYLGCENFSVLTVIVELMHGKIKFGLSNKCFDYFFGVIKRMLPKENCLPEDHKSAQKVLKGLGLGYEKIHACVNNCILFYTENKQFDKCPVCNEPRFKMTSQNRKNKIPQKVMRYLPLKPRLQRLYMSMHTLTDMRWHKEGRVNDDVTRHPADGEAWKDFDRMYPDFAADPRNVRLGLATEGFNPFGVLDQTHNTWPVVVFPYNLPPWKCMKKEYMMLTLLIGEDPGKSIDVYLRPLVDELKDLWENGVRTYDKYTGQMFTMRAVVMWTVNDFPAYAMVSGWMTKGYMACPICKENVTSSWHARKVCYLGHRRWLPLDNEWRQNDKAFHGTKETRPRLREWSGDEILDQLNLFEFGHFGKKVSKPRRSTHLNWTHKNIEGKTKDTIESRLDLERMGIRSSLWMKRVGGTEKKGHPFFTVKPNGKKEFFNFISSVKFPDGYASNISRCVNDDIVNVLCKFEQIFPPAFFTSMIHMMIHLPDEALLAGPVNCRWMYPIERYLDVETTFNRPQRNNDGGVRKEKLSVFAQIARPFGDPVKGESFTKKDMEVAHWFVLNNCDEALPYLEEHEQLMKREHPSHLYAKKHRDLFPSWFHAHVSCCHVNGVKFLGATRDDKLSTQNSGVHVPGAGDSEDIDFYGKLTSVVQLLYKDRYQVILFNCLWFDTNPHNRTSVKRDHGLLSVNTTRHWYDEDPYILATMAKQIFYLDDPKAGNGWKVVQKIDRRGLYDIPELDHDDNVADQQLSSSIELGEETLWDTNIVQEPFDVPGVPEFEISIDLGDLPQYNAPEHANEDEDEWESGNDSSEDSESYYCSSDED
ncbi:uncharacterized protein LOC126588404 [Malus sylvestris]|uniref:uncharacterized protein LOC126588404 n=1 Tax=Malus sylvestris TaxID=3752 RepID=UPI0021ABF2B7|nr:uncharacterized protein LOC126588404 [Malus sylvestris]